MMIRLRLLAGLALLLAATTGLAWDAGNPDDKNPKYSKTKCVHDECSGGVIKPKLGFAGVVAGWVSMSRVADCPAGYTNNGLTCGRGADTKSAPSRTADCPAGYTNNGPAGCGKGADTYGNPSRVADCPGGFTNMGASCYKVWPPESRSMDSMTCRASEVRHGGRCYPKCREGYTNNGEFCGRGVSLIGPSAFTCPAGYFQGVTKDRCHANCPAGYKNMGETCFRDVDTLGADKMKCKDGEWLDSGRCIPVPNVTMRGNTHLWVVNRSLDLLKGSSDPVAKKAVTAMTNADCANKWRQGLYDGDEPANVDDPLQTKLSTAGTHFYNPTGRDAFGKSTNSVTYLIGEVDVSTGGFRGKANLTAKDTAQRQIDQVPAAGPTAAKGCYELGLALHYLTDMTQPMHAGSYSGVSSPQFLHPYFEAYVPLVQTRFPASGTFNADAVSKGSPSANFEAAARKGNTLAPALMNVLITNGRQCTIDGIDLSPLPYVGYCFINDPKVDTQIGIVLQAAYQTTASYIYSVFNTVK